jgi:hypothetical protein
LKKLRLVLATVLAVPFLMIVTAAPAQACDYNPKTGCGGCYITMDPGGLPRFQCHS